MQTDSSRTDASRQLGNGADAQLPSSTETPASGIVVDSSSAARLREQRYQELLRAAPPAGAPAPGQQTDITSKPGASPTLLDRIVKPIASVLGGNRNPQTPQAMGSRQPQQPPQTSTNPETTTDPKAEKDEDSDVLPPRLMSVQFTPQQVQDGDQTTFSAIVTDDMSGVKGVSGVVMSPSGAQQGFATQRDDETRFFSKITIPKEAAEGVWTVKYLTLTDNAGNSVNLNSGQGLPPTASFRVISNSSDSKGPTLKAVWLDQQSMAAGEKNQVFVTAEDDKSGVSLVSGVFVSPSKQARIGFGCRLGGDNATWQCPVSPPTCVDCGSWQLEQIQLQDKANNMTTIRADNQVVAQVRLQLFGKDCDNTPPQITSLALDPPVVSNAEGGVIRVTAVATDDQCGVASLSGVAMPPAGGSNTRIYFPFRPLSEGGDTFIGEIQVPKHAPSGNWTIGWIQALDKGHNLKAYSSSDPVIGRVMFRVE
jgi:hypothetical protein